MNIFASIGYLLSPSTTAALRSVVCILVGPLTEYLELEQDAHYGGDRHWWWQINRLWDGRRLISTTAPFNYFFGYCSMRRISSAR
jgi:hypothetical protein